MQSARHGAGGDGDDGDGGGPLVIGETTPPSTLDPQASGLFADRFAWQLSYECLMTTTSDGEVVPNLATEYERSDDGLTYTFTLREGVEFSNGETLDADDVVYTFERLKDGPGQFEDELFPTWDGVAKVDDMTVEFTLESPDAGFINNMGNPLVWGCAIMSEAADDENHDVQMIGTGPWVQQDYEPETRLELERNESYWGDPASMEALSILYMPSMSTQVSNLKGGTLDLIFPDQGSVKGLEEDRFEITEVHTDSTIFLQVNDTMEPFDNPKLREALALAIDRQELADQAYGGAARPSGYLPPSLAWAPDVEELPGHVQDTDKARQIIEDEGFSDGVDLELIYISGYDAGTNDLVATLQAQLNDAGFNVELGPHEAATWNELKDNAKHQLAWNAQSYYANPYQYIAPVPGRQGPVPDSLQDLIDDARNADSEEAYQEALSEVAIHEADIVYPTLTLLATDMFVAHDEGIS
ncbi:MAG TPA: ABC transporter substrate-binding protein, partial [Beutenbergiaceae bacterium]|nr:ABC transporter substrate-binding protein [Beutenbergiaceae bacterium]